MDRELLQWADERLTQIEHHTSDNILYWVIGFIIVIVIIVVFIVYFYAGNNTNEEVNIDDELEYPLDDQDDYFDSFTPEYADDY